MRTIRSTIACALMFLVSNSIASAAPWSKTPQAVYVIFSNNEGLYVSDEHEIMAQKAVHETLMIERQDAKLGNQNRLIRVHLTTHSTDVAFSGTAHDLETKGGHLSERLQTMEARCADYHRTLENVLRDIRLNGHTKARIVVIGSLIHVAAPCEEIVEVTLPQPLTKEFPLATILDHLDHAQISFQMVHPEQSQELWTYIERNNLVTESHKIEILVPDEVRTRIRFDAYYTSLQNSEVAEK